MPDLTHASNHVVIVGAGISGLACALRLHQLEIPFTIFERADLAGGFLRSEERDGFLFESGPQSFQLSAPLAALIRDVAMESEIVTADPKAPRYVLRGGRLLKIPMSPQALLASSLLGPRSRWRVAAESFRKTQPPGDEESVAAFVRRKFGHEILEYLVSPFVSGVYAGDPERLSLRAAFPSLETWERTYGSVLRGARKSRSEQKKGAAPPALCSLRHGMGSLTQAIARQLGARLKTGVNVASLRRAGDGGYEIGIERAGGSNETILSAKIVIATPAYTAGRLIAATDPRLASSLEGIAYAPVAVVSAGYYDRQMIEPMRGFGVLMPRSEGLRTLGTVWNSSLFQGRAPAGMFLMTSFVGGATDLEIVERSEEEIAAIVVADNQRVAGITGPPAAKKVWRYPRALPQYNLGHGYNVEAIRAGERQLPGLFFTGNYLDGPAIGKCVESGARAAEAAARA
ncbi:MAG: protoporphyrinogen oxidase [Candidatus Acidiferrales bacterium]